MQIKEALRIGITELEKAGITTPHLDSRLIIAKVLNCSIEFIFLNFDKYLSSEEQKLFFALINKRKSYEPLAYITGEKEFYGRSFYVDERVLIPRSDTEILIDGVMEHLSKSPQNKELKILDLGTGSGVIAITLAAEIPGSKITATDLSAAIIELAKENAIKHGVSGQIEFIVSNWYQNIPLNDYDIIVCNPPYISNTEKGYMARETLLYEPERALFAADNGLSEYQIIIGGASKYLSSGGYLLLEIGFSQYDAVSEIVRNNNFIINKALFDLQGHKRAIRVLVNHRL